MNIRLFRIYSVPIRISSLELHVPGTCLFILWGGTWRLRATCVDYSYFCALLGARIYTCPYMCAQLKTHDILNKVISLIIPSQGAKYRVRRICLKIYWGVIRI